MVTSSTMSKMMLGLVVLEISVRYRRTLRRSIRRCIVILVMRSITSFKGRVGLTGIICQMRRSRSRSRIAVRVEGVVWILSKRSRKKKMFVSHKNANPRSLKRTHVTKKKTYKNKWKK